MPGTFVTDMGFKSVDEMKRVGISIAAILLTALVITAGWLGYTGASRPPDTGARPTPNAEVKTVPVQRGDVRQVLIVPGEVVPALQRELGFPVGGRLAELAVRPGDVVTQGQVLARLETGPLEQAVAVAQIDLEVKQATLEKLKAGPSAADLAIARADLAAAQAKLDKLRAGPDPAAVERARFALETARNSLWSAQLSRDAICGQGHGWQCDQAEAAVGNADVAVRQAQAELDRLLAGPSPDEIKAAELEVERAQARLAQLTAGPDPAEIKQAEAAVQAAQIALEKAQADLAAATLVAPFGGTVLDVKARPGDRVNADAPIIELADLTQLEVRVTVGQEDITTVHPGQEVMLSFDAFPEETSRGRVDRVIPRKTQGQVVTYEVFIALDETPSGLLPGMTADAEIVVAEREDVLVLPRRAIRARPYTTVSVPVLEAGRVVTRAVKIGLVGDLNAEILSGLREGDRVVVRR